MVFLSTTWSGVYWSNWAGLSDVTRSMQVQRGLGASKISSPSVGGSINIVTRSTDMARGGNVSYSVGNNGYEKISFTASTGLLDNGWAFTFLGAQTTGDGYIQGTDFEAYSWFVNISKRIGDNQTLSLTGFGAPQKHYQRSFYDGLTIENWQKDGTKYMGEGMDAYRYNPTYGFANGQRKTSAYNVYNKPQISLNHVWQINDISNLSTALYVSIGRGGGYSGKGQSAYSSSWYGSNNGSLNTEFRNSDGTFAYDKVYDLNEASTEGSQMVMTMSNNSHNWYGLLSTYETQLPYNLKASGGVDFRYYKGMHNNKIIDLYGGEYYTDNYYRSRVSSVNNSNALDPNYQYEKLGVGDVVYRDYIGYMMQEGVFGQLEGTYLEDDKLNAFVSAAVSNEDYWRVDNFYYDADNEKSSTESHIGYNVKAGANYNINAYNNVFANIGVISRQPYFSNGVFVSSQDNHMVNPNSENEKIQSAEIGYGFKWEWVALNVNAYYTKWMDKTLVKSGGDFLNADGQADRYTVNMTGVDAIHKGIEFDANFHPTKWLSFNAMLSIGDWKWDGTAEGYFYNSSGQPLADARGTLATAVGAADHAKMTLTQDDVPVGGSAQTTAALGMDVKLSKGLRFGVDYTYAGRNFADWSFNTNDLVMNGTKTVTPDVWEMPDYGTFDLNASYSFRISGLRSKLSANCNNVLNDTFIVDAMDGSGHDWQSAYRVFYGFGRTWSMRFKIYF